MPLGDETYVDLLNRKLSDDRLLLGGAWNKRTSRWEKLYGKSVVTWGRTLEVLAKEWPEETFATLDAAKRYLQRRVYAATAVTERNPI